MLTFEICLPLIGTIVIALALIVGDVLKSDEYKGGESDD